MVGASIPYRAAKLCFGGAALGASAWPAPLAPGPIPLSPGRGFSSCGGVGGGVDAVPLRPSGAASLAMAESGFFTLLWEAAQASSSNLESTSGVRAVKDRTTRHTTDGSGGGQEGCCSCCCGASVTFLAAARWISRREVRLYRPSTKGSHCYNDPSWWAVNEPKGY